MSLKLRDRYVLTPAFIVAAFMALINLGAGAPQINIDDYTLYEGGFLVWFGHAPPQHAYLECWLNGLSSLFTFLLKSLSAGNTGVFNLEFVSHAYSDFYYHPDGYYLGYRFLVALFYLATALLVYGIGRECIRDRMAGYAPAFAAILYLFSFNAFWCNLAGRPDILVAFFAMLGFYFYLKADYRDDSPWFWLAAAAFGLAAGLKLHGAFFAIFAALDTLRVKGFRKGLRSLFILVPLSLLFFVLADGALLFDPLKYVKARLMTYQDDLSPWMNWGGQFLAILRGSGWVTAPLVLGAWFFIREEDRDSSLRSVVFISLCWLALFASIRQLRAYWMLPTLPFAYISAIAVMDKMKKAGYVLAVFTLGIFLFQSVGEVGKIYVAPYNELRNWVENNISENDSAYLVGYSVLKVPRTEKVNALLKNRIEGFMAEDAKRYGFTYRHLKNWEELTFLRLLDMLIPKKNTGFNLIGYLEWGTDFLDENQFLSGFNYLIVQDKFGFSKRAELDRYLEDNFTFVTQRIGEGGQGYGLNYKIYKRKTEG